VLRVVICQARARATCRGRGWRGCGQVHYCLVVRPRGDRDSKPFSFPTTRAGFEGAARFILERAGSPSEDQVLVGIEFAGSYGFTFAHYLGARGFQVVGVLPSDTKRWKEVAHHQALKTDAKDALGITDLAATGHFVSFPFLKPEYATLRYLVSGRERVSVLRRAAITRLKMVLELVFPEYERTFKEFLSRTSLAVLKAYPGPATILAARKRVLRSLIKRESQNHLKKAHFDRLIAAAGNSLALPGAQGVLKDEIPMLIELIEVYENQLATYEQRMRVALAQVPEGEYLMTIPNVAAATAAAFLGSIGDPQAYESVKQVLKLARLSLVEKSSGVTQGKQRISKRGRPVLRRYAFILAVRSVTKGGIFRPQYEALLLRNGGKKLPALTAIGRQALTLMFCIARDRRPFQLEPPARPTRRIADSTDQA
jgi:transposase